ncbi:MAG: hypothetical protein KBA28_05190 [Syntrophaceae bacterium]|nr:hypothetical protein [Syntrophaceae bacterium]
MKRFWLVLLTLGLFAAFSTQAMAVDVKVSGEFYAAGMYLDRTSLQKNVNPSTAFYFQRLRVRTDFVVSPGLTLVTRFDAMERAWGAARTAPGFGGAPYRDSAGTQAENENIAIDWAYINYQSPIGIFDVGYMNDGATGTIFGNNYQPKGRIKYSKSFGPATLNLAYTKDAENSVPYGGNADADDDKYGIEGVYKWKTGKAGMNVNYYNQKQNRPFASNKITYFLVTPYAMAKIGPVDLQAEINYAIGDQKYEDGVTVAGHDKINLQGLSAYLDATANFNMFYLGGSLAYVSGNDPYTTDKNEGFGVNGGREWNPCLILFNNDVDQWAGSPAGYNGTATSNAGRMTNAYFYQLRGGVRPVESLDIVMTVSYAHADKTLAGATWEGRDYGYEVDVAGTYKITNNLSYMLGAGYLFTGKWFKGTTAVNHDVDNDYLVINKLTLTF